MKFNKILLLGGAYHQIPMIKEAQSQGYYVVTCDYSPENPGHKISDKYYNAAINPFVPYSTTWPSKKEHKLISKVELQISKAIKLSGYKNGPVNIEIRVDRNGEIYIMEIGPRSGGNFVPQVIRELTGFDMVKALLDLYAGKQIKIPGNPRR